MAEGLIQPRGINKGKPRAEAGNVASHSLQGRRESPTLGTFALKNAKKHKVICWCLWHWGARTCTN